MSRKSSRCAAPKKLPQRITSLFHEENTGTYLKSNFEKIHTSPNIYLISNFLTESELTWLDRICTINITHFENSFTEDDDNKEVISDERTSKYIYLSKSQDTIIRNIERRASEMVGLSSENVEPLQIVSYTENQHFAEHHDAGTLLEDNTICPVPPLRLITIFVYLNTLPYGQGHTEFPFLNLSVTPTRGSAVLFCNVLSNGDLDPLVIHQACPVEGSLIKYGMNIWISDSSFQELSFVKTENPGTHKSIPYNPTQSAFTIANQCMEDYIHMKQLSFFSSNTKNDEISDENTHLEVHKCKNNNNDRAVVRLTLDHIIDTIEENILNGDHLNSDKLINNGEQNNVTYIHTSSSSFETNVNNRHNHYKYDTDTLPQHRVYRISTYPNGELLQDTYTSKDNHDDIMSNNHINVTEIDSNICNNQVVNTLEIPHGTEDDNIVHSYKKIKVDVS